MSRRGHGEGALFYEEDRDRWVALLDLPPDGSGRRRRRKVTGRTKTDARRKLRQLQRRLEDGLPTGDGSMTLGDFLEHWLAEVLPARSRSRRSRPSRTTAGQPATPSRDSVGVA